MGFRFRKSFKIAPGVRVNVGSKSVGVSVGGKGARYSVNSSGRRTTSVGIPGSGLSYVSTSSGKKQYKTTAYQKQSQLKQLQGQQDRMQKLERARLEVELYENQLEMIHSIHKECDEYVDWNRISKSEEPFPKDGKGANELKLLEEYNNFKPTFFQKLFKQEEKLREKIKERRHQAIALDIEEYKRWEIMKEVSKEILEGNTDTYLEVIENKMPLEDLSEFGSGFEFFVSEKDFIEVEFNVKSENIIPRKTKTLTKTGLVSVKDMPITKFYDIYQDYVCSCVIRIARDMFALLPIDYIYINAVDKMLNTTTGYYEEQPILSVKIDRETLNKLNFESIDCSDAMMNFQHNMNFKKTKGFEKVERLV